MHVARCTDRCGKVTQRRAESSRIRGAVLGQGCRLLYLSRKKWVPRRSIFIACRLRRLRKRRLRQLRHVHVYVSRDTFFSGCISLPSNLLVTVSPPSAPCSRESRGILTQFYTQMSPYSTVQYTTGVQYTTVQYFNKLN